MLRKKERFDILAQKKVGTHHVVSAILYIIICYIRNIVKIPHYMMLVAVA